MQLLSGSDQFYPMTTDNEFVAPRYLPLHQVVEYLVQADFVPETIEGSISSRISGRLGFIDRIQPVVVPLLVGWDGGVLL
jgi:hypothetical protein